MIEKEKYDTAKLYMDKLSNGINPLDDENVPEDSILNDITLCRTFNFVSDVLDEVIRNDYKVSIPNHKKQKFRISDPQRSAITISDNPVKITAIANRVTRVLDPNVKSIHGIRMTQWLEAQGLLKSVVGNDGKVHREATVEGNALGIETKTAQIGNEMRVTNFYNASAQSFIIANLEDIAAFQSK